MRTLVLLACLWVSFSCFAESWTVLVYINGYNNLDSFGKKDINEMEKVGSSEDLKVVVQWASYASKKTKGFLCRRTPMLVLLHLLY